MHHTAYPHTFWIDDLVERHQQSRVAVLGIDHQYMMQNLSKTGGGNFSSYNHTYAETLTVIRKSGIPVIHVAYDLADPDTCYTLDRAEKEELLAHTQHYDTRIHTVLSARSQSDSVATDILVPIQRDEILYLKTCSSAFADNTLDTYLRSKNIDTLVLMGMYASECVLATARDAHAKNYTVAGVMDVMENQHSMPNSSKRAHNFTRLFNTLLPQMVCTTQNEFLDVIASIPAPTL